MGAPKRALFVRFLLFLLHPEDSANPAGLRSRWPLFAPFDNRLGGALKILFWIVAATLFWIAVPTLCGHLQRHCVTQPAKALPRPVAAAADGASVMGSSTAMLICAGFMKNDSLQTVPAPLFPHRVALTLLLPAKPALLPAPLLPNRCREKI